MTSGQAEGQITDVSFLRADQPTTGLPQQYGGRARLRSRHKTNGGGGFQVPSGKEGCVGGRRLDSIVRSIERWGGRWLGDCFFAVYGFFYEELLEIAA